MPIRGCGAGGAVLKRQLWWQVYWLLVRCFSGVARVTKDLEVARKEHFSIEAHPLIGRTFVVRSSLRFDAIKG